MGKNYFAGASNSTGFQIFDSNGLRITTKDYYETAEEKLFRMAQIAMMNFRKMIIPMFSMAGLSFLCTIFYRIFGGDLLSFFALLLIFIFILFASVLLISVLVSSFVCKVAEVVDWLRYYIWKFFIGDKREEKNNCDCEICLATERKYEWHSCEHKLIYLVERGSEVTISSMYKAPSYTELCGRGKGKKQWDSLRTPSFDKILEAVRVGQEYYRKRQVKN